MDIKQKGFINATVMINVNGRDDENKVISVIENAKNQVKDNAFTVKKIDICDVEDGYFYVGIDINYVNNDTFFYEGCPASQTEDVSYAYFAELKTIDEVSKLTAGFVSRLINAAGRYRISNIKIDVESLQNEDDLFKEIYKSSLAS